MEICNTKDSAKYVYLSKILVGINLLVSYLSRNSQSSSKVYYAFIFRFSWTQLNRKTEI